MRTFDQEQTTFGYALLLYIVIVVVLITLIPFEFRIPDKIQFTWATYTEDFFANIILFLPVGFIFMLNRRTNQDRFCIHALIFGTLLSVTIEFAQLFVPGRYASTIDVITNGLGAWLGGFIFVFLKKSLKEECTGRLPALELPLMNVVYLLIPLMWLTGLSAGQEVLRWWLMVLLGLFGGGVLFSIYFYHLRDGGSVGPNKLSCSAMGWFYIGALPMLTRYPLRIIFFGAVLGAVSQLLARVLKAGERTERRFELPTLKRLFPLYLIYLLLVAAWPTTVPLNEWQVFIDFQEFTFEERIVFIFRFVELIAAFTLLGYMIAQMRGRKNESGAKTLAWILLAALCASAITAVLKGPPPLIAATIFQTVGITAACLYGAVIYRLQLAAIRGSNHQPQI